MKIISNSVKGLSIRASSKTDAEIFIYAGIGEDFWNDGSMVSARNFAKEIKALPDTVKNLSLRINSPGGSCFDGITIYNVIKDFARKTGAKVTVTIDGLAASIASIIALAGDEVVMGEGALYMVHLPWSYSMGNRIELESTVNLLMDIEEQMVSIYVKKTGLSRIEVKKLLEQETWLDAAEAIEKGFVDSQVEETVAVAASIFKNPWTKRVPENFVSETMATNKKIEELKNKVKNRLAKTGAA